MEALIQDLYENINFIGYYTIYHKDNHYIEKAKELLPQVNEFAQWFLTNNQFGLDEELYRELQNNLLDILRDCTEALQERDRVLMMDALEQGISEYLKMFLSEEYLEQKEIGDVKREDN